jgi:hypothetical protein
MAKYRKVALVDARQADSEGTITTLEGVMSYSAGDYICTGPAGESWPVQREIFEATYVLVDDDTDEGEACERCGGASGQT